MKVANIARTMILPLVLILALGIAQVAQAGQANTQLEAAAQGGIVSDFYVDPTAFNTATGHTTAYFTAAAYSFVSIRVQGLSGNAVATILPMTIEGPGIHGVTWNGKDRYGRPVPEGRYSIVLLVGLFSTEIHAASVAIIPCIA